MTPALRSVWLRDFQSMSYEQVLAMLANKSQTQIAGLSPGGGSLGGLSGGSTGGGGDGGGGPY